MKILIAEDDPMSRIVLSKFLRDYGAVEVAKDGMETLDQVMDSIKAGVPYDLLFLDIMMPKVDGIKVLKVVRSMEEKQENAEENHLFIVMMSALSDMEHVDQSFALGCDAYATKPIELDKIEQILEGLGFTK